jgi:phosphoserine phosphatase RsbU/P
LRRIIPSSWMGRFTLALVVLWVLKTLLLTPRLRFYVPQLAFILDIIGPLLAIPAIYYFWKFSKYARNKLLWKIRRRLIVAYIFIGAIPIIVVVVIFYSSALLVFYQLSYFLISNQIGIHASQVHAFNLSLRDGLQRLMTENSPPTPSALKEKLDADVQYLLGAYPSASITLSYRDSDTNRMVSYTNKSLSMGPPAEYHIPKWIDGKDFHGLAIEDSQPEITTPRLFLRSFVSSDFRMDFPFSLEVSVPFDQYFLGRLKAALGQDLLLAKHVERPGRYVILQNTDILPENILESTFEAEGTRMLPRLWSIFLFPTSWTNGMEISSVNSNVLVIELSIPKLMQNLYRSESYVGEIILDMLRGTVIVFLFVEIASLVIGILLSKSITNAVYNLDRGTDFIKRGDFSQRIVVRSEDQLGSLAASFNQMTEYIQRLVKERVQKERLERELEIAKEVQEQLFPNQSPRLGLMDVTGVCLPARIVSGDYYDFLPLGKHSLGLAVGDICGKGISAALLMANLQATLRSNVMNLWPGDKRNGEKAVAEVVSRLNSQIHAYTAANKFASFFYALYEDTQQTLTYCNAGHNPPLFFSGDEVHRLRKGGTVVGIFADSKFDQETIHLKPGDLLVAYTDGIVESLNEYAEEFGEDRLINLILENRYLSADEIREKVVEGVLSWTFSEERDDDMTLLIARILSPS